MDSFSLRSRDILLPKLIHQFRVLTHHVVLWQENLLEFHLYFYPVPSMISSCVWAGALLPHTFQPCYVINKSKYARGRENIIIVLWRAVTWKCLYFIANYCLMEIVFEPQSLSVFIALTVTVATSLCILIACLRRRKVSLNLFIRSAFDVINRALLQCGYIAIYLFLWSFCNRQGINRKRVVCGARC